MEKLSDRSSGRHLSPYLSPLGAWSLACGCSVGWGAFIMPGTTFLPVAGPLGSALGLVLGMLLMLVIGANYAYMIRRFPEPGSAYIYTKKILSADHGFITAWFLILVYIAIIWANATALPLIGRTVLGDTFEVGFCYTLAGFDIYLGEILLASCSLVISTLICLRRTLAVRLQIAMVLIMLFGIVACFTVVMSSSTGAAATFQPLFSPKKDAMSGIATIIALSPWAFVGFESISHSAQETLFSRGKSFRILACSIVTSAAIYILLALLAAVVQPSGLDSWTDYLEIRGKYTGVLAVPTFFTMLSAMGEKGPVLLGLIALCGIFTGLIGLNIALSRLLYAMSSEGLLPTWLSKLDANHVPRNALWSILAFSVIMPFFGRTAVSWILDVTSIGAVIIYASTSEGTLKLACKEKSILFTGTGSIGLIASFWFLIDFIVPNLLGFSTMTKESYLILAAWGILGFIFFSMVLSKDIKRQHGRSTIAWAILLALVMFTSCLLSDCQSLSSTML